jgi:Fur family ferric uptake transcriptional regulator
MTTVDDAKRVQRGTRQWAAVSAMLDRLDDFRAAQEIHAELRPAGEGIGLTIVYRSLKALPTAAR